MPSTTESALHDPRQKKDRACDACRRRKTKCDGPMMPQHVCTNCIQTRKECTYVEASKPRGPPKAYITGLEDRLEALEALLHQLSPDNDYSAELGPPVIRGSWKSQDAFSKTSKSTSILATNILPPLLIPYQTQGPSNVAESAIISSSSRSTHLDFSSKARTKHITKKKEAPVTFDQYQSDDSYDGESSSSSETDEVAVPSFAGREKVTLRGEESDDATEDNNMRFHGRSSTAGLVEVTRQFKHIHFQPDSSPPTTMPVNLTDAHLRRRQFWKRPDWEYSYEGLNHSELLSSVLQSFPPTDLAESLVQLYFQHSNCIFPLLHRPTFEKQWKDKLYLRNIWFVDVCFAIFAVASRWSNDERVLPMDITQDEEGLAWRLSGERYFDVCMEIHRTRRSLFYPTSLFEIQALTLVSVYLKGTCAFPTAWSMICLALRKAQDVGAHRRKVYRDEPNSDDELWKRSFWHLVVLDRILSANLGRACGIAEEDFDLDLPLEVDDEYWESRDDPREAFKQPSGVPSLVSSFIQVIRLSQIIAFTLKTLYAIDRTIYRGHIKINMHTMKEQSTSAMSDWLESLPQHLKWTDNMDVGVFSNQSSFLFTLYHSTQILVHRPLIAKASFARSLDERSLNQSDTPPPIPALTDPAIIVCTDAAKAAACIIRRQKKLGLYNFYIPCIIDASYICCGLFLLRAWNLKAQERELRNRGISDIKPPLVRHIEEDAAHAKTFYDVLEAVKERWNVVDVFLGDLEAAFADLVDNTPLHRPTATHATNTSQRHATFEAPPVLTSPSDQSTSAYTMESPSVHSSKISSFPTALGRNYPFTPSPSLYPSPVPRVGPHPIRFPSRRAPQAVGLSQIPNIAKTSLWAPALQPIPSINTELRGPPTVPATPLSGYSQSPLSASTPNSGASATWTERRPVFVASIRRSAENPTNREGLSAAENSRVFEVPSMNSGIKYIEEGQGHDMTFNPHQHQHHPHQHQHGYPTPSQVQQNYYIPPPSLNLDGHGFNPESVVDPKNPRLEGWGNTLESHAQMDQTAARPHSTVWTANAHAHIDAQNYMAQDGSAPPPPRQEHGTHNLYNSYAQTM